MVDKEETPEFQEIKAPPSSLGPIFSNIIWVNSHPDVAMVDFGLLAPSYCKPYDFEDTQVARICLPWDAAEMLVDSLNSAISDHKKELKAKKRKKS